MFRWYLSFNDSYECEACGQTDESQEHVTNCNVILEMHNEWKPSEIPKYEKIMNGNLKEQVMICKIFSKNVKIIERLRRKEKWKEYSRIEHPPGTKWPN